MSRPRDPACHSSGLRLLPRAVTRTALCGNITCVATISVEDAYAKWSPDLVRYATALVGVDAAADLVADAFAEVLQHEDRWQTVREPQRYLIGVTTTIAKMSHRSTWRRRNREVRYYSPCPESELLSDPAVALGLSQLPMRQRSVLYLAYWLDMAPRDIAAALHISEGAAKRHLARGRSQMREILHDYIR